jgi:hypothetical protein
MRVVRDVEHQRRLARHDLEAARQLDQGQAVAHRLRRDRQHGMQRLDRRQHAGGVDELIGAAQCRVSQSGVTPAASGPVPLLLVATAMEIAPGPVQVGTDLERAVEHALRRHRIADNDRAAGAHDAGLLVADGLAVGAEELDMVDIDAGDDRAGRLDDVDRVQPAAQADLEDHEVELRARQRQHDRQRGELEVAQADLGLVGAMAAARELDIGKGRQQRVGRDGLALDAAALLEMHQVRRGVEAGAIAGLLVDGFEQGTGRALAVGAADDDDRTGRLQAATLVEALRHLAHPVQPHVDGLGMNALAMGKPVGQGLGQVLGHDRNGKRQDPYCRSGDVPAFEPRAAPPRAQAEAQRRFR